MQGEDVLIQEDQEMLDAIVAKPLVSLTEEDKAILRARRGYLSESALKAFASVLKEEVEVKEESDGLELMKVPDLKAICETKEIEFPADAKKAELIELIRSAEQV